MVEAIDNNKVASDHCFSLKGKAMLAIVVIFSLLAGCTTDKKVESLLTSMEKDDLINGSIKAGRKGKMKFVPLLLQNAYDPRRSTNLKHKGVSVYEAKMHALGRIFIEFPAREIGKWPDSLVIKFYMERAAEQQK